MARPHVTPPESIDLTDQRIQIGDTTAFVTKLNTTQDAFERFSTETDAYTTQLNALGEYLEQRADSADADAAATAADRQVVADDKAAVATDRQAVADHKAVVATDRSAVEAAASQVATDQQTVAADKAVVTADRAAVAESREAVESAEQSVESMEAGLSQQMDVFQEIINTSGEKTTRWPTWDEVTEKPDLAGQLDSKRDQSDCKFPRVELAINTTYAANSSATAALDTSSAQAFRVGGGVYRSVTFVNPPSGREMTIVVEVSGSAGINFTSISTSNWSRGEVPELGDSWTQFVFTWMGNYWRGGVGLKR